MAVIFPMDIKKIVITGPESTGKTELAESLAAHFDTVWIPEYAREYITRIGRRYNYDDIEHIAREQLLREEEYGKAAKGLLFYDTHLIVTRVWFSMVYGHYPEWIDGAIERSGIDLYLVCNTDIPWVPDNVRENGGEMRELLLARYIREIESSGADWRMVSGKLNRRTSAAVEIVKTHFKDYSIGIG